MVNYSLLSLELYEVHGEVEKTTSEALPAKIKS